jgi:hypothetical protein
VSEREREKQFVGGLEGDGTGVGGWGRGKWREHAGLFNFPFFFNII